MARPDTDAAPAVRDPGGGIGGRNLQFHDSV
jgi:hypothetical protein